MCVVRPRVHGDDRGCFLETWREDQFEEIGLGGRFVQDNQSVSRRGVLRGLHYQLSPAEQGKLVRVAHGAVFDVAVDLRRSSNTFGAWIGRRLDGQSHEMLWIPPGFAHGFYTLSETAVLVYRCTGGYSAEHDRSLRWDDPGIGIDWPLADDVELELSDKDRAAPGLADAELFA